MKNDLKIGPFALLLAVSTTTLLSIGCTDKKKASTSNFESALQDHFKTRPVCLTVAVTLPNAVAYDTKGPVLMNDKVEEALVAAGVMTSKQEMKAIPNAWTGQTTNKRVVTYSPVDASNWRALGADKAYMSPCYAKVDIERVDNFTEPGDYFGRRVSQVSFTYKATDVQAWAHNPAVEQAFPAIQQLTSADERKGTAPLILTNNGWEVDPTFRL